MRYPYDTTYQIPAPSLDIHLGEPGEVPRLGPFRALVDTGADICLVPIQHIQVLGVTVDNYRFLRSQWGEPRRVGIYAIDIGLHDLRFVAIPVVADTRSNDSILGRNFLNKLLLVLNGPQRILEIDE